jgi:hypothetical protein
MTKLPRCTLILILALGIPFAAHSGKPPKDETVGPQILISPPMYGEHFVCTAYGANTDISATDVDVQFNLTDGTEGILSGTITVRPATTEFFKFSPPDWVTYDRSRYCIIEWTGKSRDIRGTICGFDDPEFLIGRGCLELDRD